MARYGAAAHAPIGVSPDGDLTYVTDGADRWEGALQVARRRDAQAVLRLAKRQGLRLYGAALHVVELSGD